jgi:hypothetical protein
MSNVNLLPNNPTNLVPRSSNTDKDKFLFVLEPNNLAVDCCCGCSLKTGVQIISIFLIICSLSNFTASLQESSTLAILINMLSFLLYFTAGFYIFYSTMNFNYTYSKKAYLIYSIIFLVSLLDNILFLLMIISGNFKPLGEQDRIRTALIFLAAVLISMSIQLYLLWIVFSYSIHLKHKRIALVTGHLAYYKDDVEHQ